MTSQMENTKDSNPIIAQIESIDVDHSLIEFNRIHADRLQRKAERMKQMECSRKEDRLFEVWTMALLTLTTLASIVSMIEMVH